MSSCTDLRNQLTKCKNPVLLLSMQQALANFSGTCEADVEQFKLELERVADEAVKDEAQQLKDLIRELDCEGGVDLSEIIDHTQLQEENGFIFPHSIAGLLNLSRLISIDKLKLPSQVGSLNLDGLTCAKGLVLPQINRSLDLNGITSAKGLVLPTKIKGHLGLNGLTSTEELMLPEEVGGNLSLKGLTNAERLVLPEIIGEWLELDGLTSAEGLVLPNALGLLCLRGLTSAKGLVLSGNLSDIYMKRRIYDEWAHSISEEELQKYAFNLHI